MDFWKKAQAAAEKLINSEAAAEMARIAQQATQQAAALAKEATEKAQEVAKEAVSEAQRSLSYIGSTAETPGSAAPLQYGITPELEQFVRSLTYSTFSDYPLDSLDVPAQPEQQKLDPWQETHARLLLEQVPQLQDLRFVLCPKIMDEYIFWMIYFTLSRRYLPEQPEHTLQQQQQQSAEACDSSSGHAATSSSRPQSTHSMDRQPLHKQQASFTSGSGAEDGGHQQLLLAEGGAAAAPAASDGWQADGAADEDVDDVDVDAELAALADDPELDAYLQDALQLDGAGDGAAEDDSNGGVDGEADDLEDLDDYMHQLDAEAQKS